MKQVITRNLSIICMIAKNHSMLLRIVNRMHDPSCLQRIVWCFWIGEESHAILQSIKLLCWQSKFRLKDHIYNTSTIRRVALSFNSWITGNLSTWWSIMWSFNLSMDHIHNRSKMENNCMRCFAHANDYIVTLRIMEWACENLHHYQVRVCDLC